MDFNIISFMVVLALAVPAYFYRESILARVRVMGIPLYIIGASFFLVSVVILLISNSVPNHMLWENIANGIFFFTISLGGVLLKKDIQDRQIARYKNNELSDE